MLLLLACTGDDPVDCRESPPVDDTATSDSVDSGGSADDTGPTVDADADDDGWPVDTDCDDGDPSVHPGAEDSWYDGVDSDCAGDDDFDQDGDGYAALSGKGTDCDDTDYTSHPGGTEQCDPADHDCDGVPFPDGICAEAQDFSVLGKEISRFYSGESLILPDVTGDGVADLVSQQSRALDGVVVWQADEPLPVQTAGTFPDSTFATWYETSTNTISGPLVAGDVNGDGYDDLAFARNLSPAGIAVFYGPVAEDGGTVDGEYPDLWWEAGCPDSHSACYYYSAFGDFDGDGLSDAISTVEDDKEGGTYVFYADGGDARIRGGSGGDFLPLGDLDGDGYPEVANGNLILGGVGLAGGYEVEHARLDYGDGASANWWERFPDIDGDGVEELVYSGSVADWNQDWEMLFFPPTIVGSFGVEDATGGFRREDAESHGYFVRRCSAFGGGGFSVYDKDGGDYGVEVFQLPDTLPARGTLLPSRAVRIEGGVAGSGHTNCGDVTGDGIEDISFFRYQDVADEDRALILIPGFELDWTDDALWGE